MKSNNSHKKVSAEGKVGMYHNASITDPRICFQPNNPSGITVISDYIFIPANRIAEFCAELIEMARVLGVTGQEKGNK